VGKGVGAVKKESSVKRSPECEASICGKKEESGHMFPMWS
jgi:hypothetical protein